MIAKLQFLQLSRARGSSDRCAIYVCAYSASVILGALGGDHWPRMTRPSRSVSHLSASDFLAKVIGAECLTSAGPQYHT
jgi:hypothetical protein